MKIRPIIKNNKNLASSFILDNFPENYQEMHYIEPFFSDGGVLLNKKRPIIKAELSEPLMEIANNVNPGIIAIYKIIRDKSKEFEKLLKKTKHNDLFSLKKNNNQDKVFKNLLEHALNEIIAQSINSGQLKKSLLKSENSNVWKAITETLPNIAERIKDIYLFQKQPWEVINAFDHSDVLLYVNLPYLSETKNTKNIDEFEMDTDDHVKLADTLIKFSGKVIISGYSSTLHNRVFAEWFCVKKHLNYSKKSKKETKNRQLWMNYKPSKLKK